MSARFSKVVRPLAAALALGGVCVAMVAARVVWSSRVEWAAAQASSAQARLVHLGRAARMYAPLNPYSQRALDELAATARRGGASELVAWREVRSAILATRSFYTPRAELLGEANDRIAQLMADLETSAAPRAGRPPSGVEARRWHAARLAEDHAPRVGWTLVALLGLFGWVSSAAGFCLVGLDAEERLRRRPALLCGVGVVLGLLAFFVGLNRA